MCISLVINKLQYDARYLQRQITISIISAATFLSSLAICGFCRECSVFLETEEKLWRVSVKECKASDLCARRISWNVFRVFRTKKNRCCGLNFFLSLTFPFKALTCVDVHFWGWRCPYGTITSVSPFRVPSILPIYVCVPGLSFLGSQSLGAERSAALNKHDAFKYLPLEDSMRYRLLVHVSDDVGE